MTLTHHTPRHAGTPVATEVWTRDPLRRLTVVLLGVVAVLYAAVFAVQLPHLTEADNPAPLYAVLALAYLAMAVIAARVDTVALDWALATVQLLLLALFAWSVGMLYTEGDEAFILDMQWLAGAVTLIQVMLTGVLVYRGLSSQRRR